MTTRLLFTALLCSGCSLATVTPLPPKYEQMEHFRCTSSAVAPGLDLLWTAGAVATAIIPIALARNGAKPDLAPVVGGAAGTILFGASAGYGFTHAADCAKAEDALNARLNEKVSSAIDTAKVSAETAGDAAEFKRLTTKRDPQSGTTLRLQLGKGPPVEVRFEGTPQSDPRNITLTIQQRSQSAFYADCAKVTFLADGAQTESSGSGRYATSMFTVGSIDEEFSVVVSPDALAPLVAAQEAKLDSCGKSIRLGTEQRALLGEYLKQWEALAAKPLVAPSPVQGEPAPVQDAAPEMPSTPHP